jgi:xanthine dehydrogenase accessory factor
MRELRQIIAAFESLCREQRAAALATVVRVDGSAYRRPGARMLIAADGQSWGGVSGGCLERDVARLGRQLIAEPDSPAMIRWYETTEDDAFDASQPGPSLGCGGAIQILIERVAADCPGPLATITRVLHERKSAHIATLISTGASSPRRWIYFDNQWLSRHAAAPYSTVIENALAEMSQSIQHLRLEEGPETLDVLLERIAPPQPLVIFGDGSDVGPVVELAKMLGWHISLVSRQSEDGLRNRFPGIDAIYSEDRAGVALTADAAVLVMTHNVRRDAAALRLAVSQNCAYIGALGPKRRTQRLLQSLPGLDSQKVFAPVGLDIGAESSEEIALAAIAEIQSVLKNRPAGRLSDRSGPIHVPTPSLRIPAGRPA